MKKKIGVFGTLMIGLVLVMKISAQLPTSHEPNMMADVPEAQASFTTEQLKDYYIVYENKAVKHVRTVIDRYLKNPKKIDDETKNLRAIDRTYLKSKFNVLSRDPDFLGNTHILLVFVDKPDRVFLADVYTGGELRLDRFVVDERFNDEDMRRLRIRYRKFLEDNSIRCDLSQQSTQPRAALVFDVLSWKRATDRI